MSSILILDTLYPAFLDSLPFDPEEQYDDATRKILARSFGTGDFYSRNLRVLGWEAIDVIANHGGLNRKKPFAEVIEAFQPDVIFLQDLSLPIARSKAIVAAQCSCPWPGDEQIRKCNVIFTSFPHYVERIQSLGVKAIYNPLAFEPIVLEKANSHTNRINPERIHDVVFIGGVGNPSHWKAGMEVLNAVAEAIPTFKWWGYGLETLPGDSPLRRCYQGEAWGLEMYDILRQSKICLNRHGEVAQGFANNMRMFEATGCGAALLTEDALNLPEFFSEDEVIWYNTAQQAVDEIKHWLADDVEREKIARSGQKRTLKDHTYQQRMKLVSETLKAML